MTFSQIELDRHSAIVNPLKVGDTVRGLCETYCLPSFQSWKKYKVTKVKVGIYQCLSLKK